MQNFAIALPRQAWSRVCVALSVDANVHWNKRHYHLALETYKILAAIETQYENKPSDMTLNCIKMLEREIA